MEARFNPVTNGIRFAKPLRGYRNSCPTTRFMDEMYDEEMGRCYPHLESAHATSPNSLPCRETKAKWQSSKTVNRGCEGFFSSSFLKFMEEMILCLLLGICFLAVIYVCTTSTMITQAYRLACMKSVDCSPLPYLNLVNETLPVLNSLLLF